MLISRETDYSIRILRYLADGSLHTVSDVCDSEQIPRHFGYKIVEKLQMADLVTCTKGVGGGCKLIADLEKVSLYDVMCAVGHECNMNLCLTPGHVCTWQEQHPEACRVHMKLGKMQETVNEQLKTMNMKSVIFD